MKSFLLIVSPFLVLSVGGILLKKSGCYEEVVKLVVEVALAPFGLLALEDSFELGKNAYASVFKAVVIVGIIG